MSLSRRSVSAASLAAFAVVYAAFVVYGSLLPFDFRPQPLHEALSEFRHVPYLELGVASRADWVANILLYIPLAFAAAGAVDRALGRGIQRLFGAALVAAACVALAFAVEFAQLFFPPRTVSQNDLIAESLGTAIGIALWFTAGPRLLGLWERVGAGGPHAWRAMLVLYLLTYVALSFFPFDLLVSRQEIADKLANPGRSAWVLADSCVGVVACSVKLAGETLLAAPLGALFGLLFPALRLGSVLVVGLVAGLVIEAGQLLLASGVAQGMSVLTRGVGFALGLALHRTFHADWLLRHRSRVRALAMAAVPAYLVLLVLLNGFGGALEPLWAAGDKLAATRFLPFYYHYYTSETAAMWSLLANAGAYAMVGVLAWLLQPTKSAGWQAGAIAALLALAIEAMKLFVPGKKPDPTNVLIALAAAWIVNAVLVHLSEASRSASGGQRAQREPRQGRRALAVAATATAVLVGVGGLLIASPHTERPVDESTMAQLAPGHELPAVSFRAFRTVHPRLPHPAASEIARLRAEGGPYLQLTRRLAGHGRATADGLYARTLLEVLEPGSQDLERLHEQLMAIRFSWRGHAEVKPIALAYDWLHDRWTPDQRERLQRKLADGCEYLIKVIREQRLSPYNVYLYNAPFQALVACSLSLYGDHPRGEPVMRFTHDLWLNRVLPVWRQVMGRNGGWHEGGEYVGIGIGAAVYQVPAMWRAATGEDFFASEPGLRGFLDFAVHRTQPDGTHVRLGDGSHFDRPVPDQLPLAIEYRHAAAFGPRGRLRVAPTAWPWGPLPDASLSDASALSRLPTSVLFDGIGWVVARSDWTPGATFVTFKAGDHYWSHSHLDQGGFTIFKGGPLAIDSGANYGPQYGSDHHLNYSAQTIAHNTITVTDPRDTEPMPARPNEQPRTIANDGGQRRIGSGWGVEAAPLDLAEWEAKREIYHAGKIVRHADEDGITLAVADITAAYTNALSGKGTFSHRTRRVERAWRTFAYDRVDDVVIVYDDVLATRPEFRKRWLLHTISRPSIDGRRFVAEVAPRKEAGRGGGRLQGEVLLPRAAALTAIGGPGFEFFVDGRNFGDIGRLADVADRTVTQRTEAGGWRVELTSDAGAAGEQFLVALLPTRFGERPVHRVRLVEDAGRVGAEVAGPRRTVRYWFRPGELSAEVEVVGGRGR